MIFFQHDLRQTIADLPTFDRLKIREHNDAEIFLRIALYHAGKTL